MKKVWLWGSVALLFCAGMLLAQTASTALTTRPANLTKVPVVVDLKSTLPPVQLTAAGVQDYLARTDVHVVQEMIPCESKEVCIRYTPDGNSTGWHGVKMVIFIGPDTAPTFLATGGCQAPPDQTQDALRMGFSRLGLLPDLGADRHREIVCDDAWLTDANDTLQKAFGLPL